MKLTGILLILALTFSLSMSGLTFSGQKEVGPKINVYEGRHFRNPQDPDYKDYDLALRTLLIKRIQKKFGVELSQEVYSGFDLLEIESFLRLKKPNEPFDPFLKMFPRVP